MQPAMKSGVCSRQPIFACGWLVGAAVRQVSVELCLCVRQPSACSAFWLFVTSAPQSCQSFCFDLLFHLSPQMPATHSHPALQILARARLFKARSRRPTRCNIYRASERAKREREGAVCVCVCVPRCVEERSRDCAGLSDQTAIAASKSPGAGIDADEALDRGRGLCCFRDGADAQFFGNPLALHVCGARAIQVAVARNCCIHRSLHLRAPIAAARG